jgi:hypothetical protein
MTPCSSLKFNRHVEEEAKQETGMGQAARKRTTRHYFPEDRNPHIHRCENPSVETEFFSIVTLLSYYRLGLDW